MIFVDASAIVALVCSEDGYETLADTLQKDVERATSATAVFEAVLAIVRIKSCGVATARALVDRFLSVAEVRLVPFGQAELDHVLDAFDRFGKGRHPARLNMGDCFAYGCAKAAASRLLFKGDDFTRTDIEPA